MKEKYKTAFDLAKEMNSFVICSMISGKEPKWTMGYLMDVFNFCVKENSDKDAKDVFAVLMKCVEDIELLPFVGQDGRLSRGDDVSLAEITARKAQAAMAMKMYNDAVGFHAKRFPETVEEMIMVIASQWKGTRDEEEADKIFNFLVFVFVDFYQAKGKDVLGKIIESIVDLSFPIMRLVRHTICFILNEKGYTSFSGGAEEEIFRVMKAGWMKWIGSKNFARILRVFQPLFEEIHNQQRFDGDKILLSSAFNALEQDCQRFPRLFRAAESLREEVESKLWFSFGPGHSQIPRIILNIDTGRDTLCARLDINRDFIFMDCDQKKFGRKFFQEAKSFLSDWFRTHCVIFDIKCLLFELRILSDARQPDVLFENKGIVLI